MKFLRYSCGLVLLGILPAWAGTLVQFGTPFGTLDVELYDADKPVTVRNFIRYVQSGAYSNMFFHRCLPNFVVQGGGVAVVDRSIPKTFDSFSYVTNYANITNEFNVGRRYSNTFGTLAMAKLGGDPNSASSQWFFNLADNSANLDQQNGGFTVFGHVVGGTNELNGFNGLARNGGGIVDLTYWYGANAGLFSDCPVTYTGMVPPKFTDLMYVDITLLQLRVQANADGTRLLSWNSVGNRVNHVEFTTNLPPSWQDLSFSLGTGNLMQVTDSQAGGTRRFYRVRVDY